MNINMLSPNGKSYLPVPFLPEKIQYTTRQPHSFRTRPPKLQPKHDTNLNRTLNGSLCAHAISFKDNNVSYDGYGTVDDNNHNQHNQSHHHYHSYNYNQELLNSIYYNKNSKESYFEQCFEIIAKIGEGSFGEVFKVRCKEDGLLYAVKKSKKLFRSESYRQERLEEVKRYEQFSEHEHCIKLYKAWEQDDRLYMQMELCRENLENYLSRKCNIPEPKIWSILLDLLLALKSLHDKNLIHLDIKLDNILISEDGYCKLGDFGLVVDVDKANLNSAIEGDSRYVASEVMQGKFSKAADIFSLGITILELSCNLELPPNGPLWQELRMGILPSQFIAKISLELQNVIKLMMHPDPAKRPTVDQLLSHKKLVELQQKRKRWSYFRKITNSYRRVSRFMWTKVCNLKNLFNHYVLSFIAIFKFEYPKIMNKNDNNIDDNSDDDDKDILNESNHSNNNSKNMQFHSTPLNHNSISLRKSKKYLSTRAKCTPSLFSSSDELNSNEFDWNDNETEMPLQQSSVICKQLFISDDSD